MLNSFLIILCLFSFFVAQIENSIGFQDDVEIKNTIGATLFRILDGDRIKLPNRFRSSSSLRLSLNGAVIDKVQEQSNESSWLLTLSDKSTAELSVLEKDSLVEYYLIWHGGGPNVDREVCFHYAYNGASWYSTYYSLNAEWPLDTSRILSRNHFNNLLQFDHYSTAPGEYLYILEHLFVNSDGFALLLDEHQPLFIRRDPNHGDPVMCFSVAATSPYLPDQTGDLTYLDIKVRLLASKNIKTATDYVVHQSGYIPKPKEIPDEHKFVYPSSFNGYGTQSELMKYVDELEKRSFPNVEIFSWAEWSKSRADYEFDVTRFPTMDSAISQIKSKGFRLCLEVHPMGQTTHEQSKTFFLKHLDGTQTQFIDFTRSDATDWHEAILKKLHYEAQISSYLVYSPTIQNVSLRNPKYPNVYYKNYIESVVKSTGRNTTSWLAFKTQHLPIFLQFINSVQVNYAQELSMIVKKMLSVSVGGYSFVVPVRIGERIPDKKELIEDYLIRWTQAVALMPSFAFIENVLWENGAKLLDLSKKFMYLHEEHAPTIIELARKRVTEGSPIIRPLWYVAPDDPKTYQISDQFMLGNDILVAPVLVIGQRERNVYFPVGIWIDQHGKEFIGPGEIKIAAPLEELPYFKRKQQ